MDLDGIMCYAIAKIFQPNMEIAGYSDSATQFFKAKYAKIANTVCLDLYCKTKGLACIDNHIIDIVIRTIEEEFKHNTTMRYALSLLSSDRASKFKYEPIYIFTKDSRSDLVDSMSRIKALF